MPNIFVEGIPGSGKSTLLNKLKERIPSYQYYYEGDISPIELAWCSYMTEEQYKKALQDLPQFVDRIKDNTKLEDSKFIVSYTRIHTEEQEFYKYMETYEIYGGRRDIHEFKNIIMERYQKFHGSGYVFECSFFQNIIDELILYAEYEEEQIIEFYKELISNISEDYKVIRLVSCDIESSLKQIKEERKNEQGEEVWYHLMMDYIKQSPYGKTHNVIEFADLLEYFKRRIYLEERIMTELLLDNGMDLVSKNYEFDEIEALLLKN